MKTLRVLLLFLVAPTACAHGGPAYDLSDLDQRPVRTEGGRCPAEPESDFGAGWEYVWMAFSLDPEGSVDAVQVRRGPQVSPEEAAAAEDALRSCTYRPGLIGGQAVAVKGLTRRVRVPRSPRVSYMPVDTLDTLTRGSNP